MDDSQRFQLNPPYVEFIPGPKSTQETTEYLEFKSNTQEVRLDFTAESHIF